MPSPAGCSSPWWTGGSSGRHERGAGRRAVRIYEDLRVVQSRLAVLQALAVALVPLLVIQFWNLQVIRARHFREPGGEQPLAPRDPRRAARRPPRPRGPRPRGQPPLVQRRARPGARREPRPGGRPARHDARRGGGGDPRAARPPPALPSRGGEDRRHARGRRRARGAAAGAAGGQRRGGAAALVPPRLGRRPRARPGGRDHGAAAGARGVQGPRPGLARGPGRHRVGATTAS